MSDLTRYRIVREVEVESYPTGRLTTVPIYEPDDMLQQIAAAWRDCPATYKLEDDRAFWPLTDLLDGLVTKGETPIETVSRLGIEQDGLVNE